MRFLPTEIPGAFIVEPAAHRDARGCFARIFCQEAFAAAGIDMRALQVNLSHNARAGTLRGLHIQAPPHCEPKLVQCVRGQAWDVALDLRPSSPAYGRSVGVDLAAGADRLFYIPPGCAHGFLTRADDTDLLYLMGAAFVADAGHGVRWNDPAFGVPWPAEPAILSERDATYPDFALPESWRESW